MVTSVTLLVFASGIEWASICIYKVHPTRPNARRGGAPPVKPHTKRYTSEPPDCPRNSHWFQWHTPPSSQDSGMYTAAATCSASLASCLNWTGYCAICAISPFKRAPASCKLNTFYTPAIGTFTTIEGAATTQS